MRSQPLQQDQDRPIARGGEVGHGGVDAHHQIEALHHRCRIEKGVRPGIKLGAQLLDGVPEAAEPICVCPGPFCN
jgi:hypothetical protein